MRMLRWIGEVMPRDRDRERSDTIRRFGSGKQMFERPNNRFHTRFPGMKSMIALG